MKWPDMANAFSSNGVAEGDVETVVVHLRTAQHMPFSICLVAPIFPLLFFLSTLLPGCVTEAPPTHTHTPRLWTSFETPSTCWFSMGYFPQHLILFVCYACECVLRGINWLAIHCGGEAPLLRHSSEGRLNFLEHSCTNHQSPETRPRQTAPPRATLQQNLFRSASCDVSAGLGKALGNLSVGRGKCVVFKCTRSVCRRSRGA